MNRDSTTFIDSSLGMSNHRRTNQNSNIRNKNSTKLSSKIRRSRITNVYADYIIQDEIGDIIGIAVNKHHNSEIQIHQYSADEISQYYPKSRDSLRTHYFWVKNSEGYESEIFCKRKNSKLVLTAPIILEDHTKDLLRELPTAQ
jgi:hypothetical protein